MALVIKNLPANAGWCKQCGFHLLVGKIPWGRKWHPTLVFLPGKFHGQRSLVGYHPWGHKDSDTTEWLSTRFKHSKGYLCSWRSEVKLLSRIRLFATPWTVADQAPPPMGFSRQDYWSRLPFPSPGDLPDPGIEPRSSALQADALTSEPPGKPICDLRRV